MKSHITFRFPISKSATIPKPLFGYVVALTFITLIIDRSILYNVRPCLELGEHKHGEEWPCVTVVLILLAGVLNIDVPFGEQCG